MILLSDISDHQLMKIVREARKVEGAYLKIVIPRQESHDDSENGDEIVIQDFDHEFEDGEDHHHHEIHQTQNIVEIDMDEPSLEDQENQDMSDYENRPYLNEAQAAQAVIIFEDETTDNKNMCLLCAETFPSRKECGIHYFSTHVALNAEERELALKLNKFACGETGCYATFSCASAFLDHCLEHGNIWPPKFSSDKKKMYRSGKSKLNCKICDAAYLTPSSLKRHMVTHGDKSLFQCEICLKEFGTTFNLKRHQKTHLEKSEAERIPTHICDICGGKYISKDTLKIHTKTVHGQGEKPHTCELCGKSFYRSFVLKRHLLSHTGEKPFECDTCKARFGTRSSLLRHRKVRKHD